MKSWLLAARGRSNVRGRYHVGSRLATFQTWSSIPKHTDISDPLARADERAKAAPGCPFTTSVDTAKLAANDPDRCIVEARWFTPDESIDLSR
jgi:hypothetical protein